MKRNLTTAQLDDRGRKSWVRNISSIRRKRRDQGVYGARRDGRLRRQRGGLISARSAGFVDPDSSDGQGVPPKPSTRLEATVTHMLGPILSKSEERATGYGRYGYGCGYGAKGRLKKTEILMIPQGSDQDQDASLARADG